MDPASRHPPSRAAEEQVWEMNWLFMANIFCNVKSSALPNVSVSISPSSEQDSSERILLNFGSGANLSKLM